MRQSVSLVSPVYNDIHSMPRVLPHIEKLLARSFARFEILLIDDGSSDGSRQWIAAYSKGKKHIRVYYHRKNLGIARTYRELYAKSKNDVIVLFSLDGEWDPRDAIGMAKMLRDRQYDAIVGVRTHKSYTLWRTIVSSLYNSLTQILFGVATRDAGSIKALRREVTATIPVISYGVFDEAERLIRAKKAGYRIGFMDVHHARTIKKRRGIRISHVLMACIDSVRVFVDLHV